MSIHSKAAIASVALAAAIVTVGEAHAAKIFKGVAVITARTNIPACVAEYDVGESFVVEYKGNVGAETTPERFSIIGPNGSLLLTNNDATPTLRGAGKASVSGNILAEPVTIASINTQFSISAVSSATLFVTMTGTAYHLAVPNCHVSIRAALTYLPPNGY
ncbi:MAG: hypothetical protein ABIK36_04415 [Pseudomonadota bacterium]